jgi:hypothetical protein
MVRIRNLRKSEAVNGVASALHNAPKAMKFLEQLRWFRHSVCSSADARGVAASISEAREDARRRLHPVARFVDRAEQNDLRACAKKNGAPNGAPYFLKTISAVATFPTGVQDEPYSAACFVANFGSSAPLA